jgi:hypothetical protein
MTLPQLVVCVAPTLLYFHTSFKNMGWICVRGGLYYVRIQPQPNPNPFASVLQRHLEELQLCWCTA